MKFHLCVVLALFYFSKSAHARINVCYWGTWAHYREGNGNFSVGNIDPTVCTHFIYSFLGAREDGEIYYMDPWLDIELGLITNFIALRNQNPNARFIYSVGGWNAGSEVFSRIAASAALRTRFTNNALAIANLHGFDGFDLDWEYPNQRDSVHGWADRENFVLLCRQLYNTFHAARKIFGIAVAATPTSAALSYDVPHIHPYTDFILIMTYDLHGSWNSFTGIHGAMYAGTHDLTPIQQELNVYTCINWWISQGAPRSKIIMGLPSYGRSFTLTNANQNGVNALSSGPGIQGEYSGESGFLTFMEVCQRVNQRGWTSVWEGTQRVPYSFNGNQWVGYDNIEAISYKLDYIIRENLGGSMWWSLESDDFRNLCGYGSFPLIRLAQSMMQG